ncbi:MAG: thiamine pyrophosphate-binding protein [Chloroflexi bacterium]|nr:MAG: thiamine pyrophosphate-binding protein [Chloroflexota bacterium]
MTRRDIPSIAAARPAAPEWGSDVVAEMLRRLDIPYIALEPGASFRGLHDSIVNYLGNERPAMILANHEEVAVAIAHGYAKVTGRAMAAAVHSSVGLMHATMTIFCAWVDRMPVVVIGATGPMDAAARRPWIDWIHTSEKQGELVRDFVKWEHQPSSVAAFPNALLRAWQLANLEPRGPVYVCLDAGLQEQRLEAPVAFPDVARIAAPSAPAPDPDALAGAARLLVEAERPAILLGRTGAWPDLVALAESLGAAVASDGAAAVSFPTDHPLHQGASRTQSHDAFAEAVRDADVILALERVDVAGALREREGKPVRLINVTLEPYATRSWVADYQELPHADVAITASADQTVPALRVAVERGLADRPAARRAAEDRARELAERSRGHRAQWAKANAARRDGRPIHLARALGELRAALGERARDAIVAQRPLGPWPAATWEFACPGTFLGNDGGAAVGSGTGITVGAALAAQGSGRPVIGVLGDGETLASPQAFWTAAHHRIPVLVLVANNQTYFNDEEHQDRVAVTRQRPRENRWVGQRMEQPAVDFASLARDLGAEGFGPVEDPAELARTFAAAVKAMDAGGPVVVDVRIASR